MIIFILVTTKKKNCLLSKIFSSRSPFNEPLSYLVPPCHFRDCIYAHDECDYRLGWKLNGIFDIYTAYPRCEFAYALSNQPELIRRIYIYHIEFSSFLELNIPAVVMAKIHICVHVSSNCLCIGTFLNIHSRWNTHHSHVISCVRITYSGIERWIHTDHTNRQLQPRLSSLVPEHLQ